jgi:ADP-dependent NAD(P)H-hydrate dehydratase / NAD(P)H-hydrate epimerase
MEILNAQQIREWDEYTMEHEPILSIDLMERAASKCLEWMHENGYAPATYSIFCGKGNNGGDGLAIARMLSSKNCRVIVYILEFGHKGTADFQINLARLHQTNVEIKFIQTSEHFPEIDMADIVIDALLGSGLNRPLNGVTAELVEHINRSGNKIISIDLPSGLFVDKSSKGNSVIKATHTLSFQCYKLAFLQPENGAYIGDIHLLDIGLSTSFLHQLSNAFILLDEEIIGSIFKPKDKFSHKGNFGHALLIAGSYGKMGAASIAAKACMRSGLGLLTCHVPICGYEILQIAVPEAMISLDTDEKLSTVIQEELTKYDVLGIGPGIGTDARTSFLLESILTSYKKPIVLDADALNIISNNTKMLEQLPPYSILTPHLKEFERLFGPSDNDFERIELVKENAQRHQCVIVLKGHHTCIGLPDGKLYFNNTGNAGLAKGGSGDALTGMITSFLAQGYSSKDAAIVGVHIHGMAGDIAASFYSQHSMIASDIIGCIGQAILSINKH